MKPRPCIFAVSSPVSLILLTGFLWTLVLPAQAHVPRHAHFQLKVDSQNVSAETFLMERLPLMCDIDGDGSEEIFVEWKRGRYGTVHHYQVFKRSVRKYRCIGDFELGHMPQSRMEIVREPDAGQPGKVIIMIQFNSTSGTYYLFRRDGKLADRVITAMHDEHVDLDGDGIYEWVFFHKFSDSLVLRLPYKARGISVFQWDDATLSYRETWPKAEESYAVLGGILYDVDEDGHAEIVALTDTGKRGHPERCLSLFKLSAGLYRCIAQLNVTLPAPAIDILAIRHLVHGKQILLQLRNEHKSLMAGYDFKDGQLQNVWIDERIQADYPWSDGVVNVVDIDEDGQEEILFLDKEAGRQILLRGSNEFSILVPENE